MLAYYQPLGKTKETFPAEWEQFLAQLKGHNIKFNLGVVCSFGYMIPDQIIDYFSQGSLL
jgi:hypothetical protein